MIKKNKFMLGMFVLILVSIISFSSSSEQSYCCEKTTEGELCQEVSSLSLCDSNFLSSSGLCNRTSYCRTGVCVDNTEGICLPNTPKKVCEEEGGFWSDKSISELAQCSYGCCYYGEQAALTTQTRCGTLASLFGLNSTFRTDITDEIQCIASAGLQEKGACVFVQSGTRNCRMLTKGECNSLKGNEENENVEFHEGYLCTAGFLDTICKPLGGTTCVPGKSEVYFKDTCGNIANIYDSENVDLKNLKNEDYWTRIYEKEESCGWESTNGNANSASCGNCDYFSGSVCEEYNKDENKKPIYGNYVCGDLSCDYDLNGDGDVNDKGEKGAYKHGEKWCVTNNDMSKIIYGYSGITRNNSGVFLKEIPNVKNMDPLNVTVPGTEHYVMKCYNGQILMEGCSVGNWRNKVCVETEVEGMSNAACVANLWQDCLAIENKEDCLDIEKRDCKWIEGYSFLKDEKGNPLGKDENGEIGTCVPKTKVANQFWSPEGDTGEMCSMMNDITVIEYRVGALKGLGDMDENHYSDRKDRNEYCYTKVNTEGQCSALDANKDFEYWLKPRMEICAAIGDCTGTTNFIGDYGEEKPLDLVVYKFIKRAKDLQGALDEIQNG